MPRLSEQILVPHLTANMYELVRDIRRYPEFIKWIKTMGVSQEEDGPQTYSCVGTAHVHFKGFDERFATRVRAHPDQNKIEVELASGPFRHLRNRWQFDDRGDGHTRVHFFIDYEFRNPLLAMVARTNSRLAVEKIMSAFRAEADRRFARTA